MDLLTLVQFIAGLGLLIGGAEALVKGASRLAVAAGVSPLVIGLTVVAYGTSAPEMAVSAKAALAGQADIALGNVVGSNIFNVLVILGLSAMIRPLSVSMQLIRRDVPLMIGASLLVLVLAWNGSIGVIDGAILFAGAIIYTVWSIRESRKETKEAAAIYEEELHLPKENPGPWYINVLWVLGGLALLVLGSRWLVAGAIAFAKMMGVSELVIGLTIVAAGTSLPEVATSILATLRGERDIAVGNVVGSNIFNIFAVLGLSGMLSGTGIVVPPAMTTFDIPVMIAVAFVCLPIFFTGGEISRWEGLVLFIFYVAYTVHLILVARHAPGAHVYSTVVWGWVSPLVLVTLCALALKTWSKKRGSEVSN